jgi:serine/threonine protein kinase
MTPEHWSRIEALFEAAVDMPAAERRAFLASACGADAGLSHEIEAMLAGERTSGPFLNGVVSEEAQHAAASHAKAAGNSITGRRFGPWRVTGLAGRGGMGSVYRVERHGGHYHKQAALKVLRGGVDSDFLRERFRYERQILAQLEHPNIARLIDGGESLAGEIEAPYLVMEFVEGEPITAYCDSHSLPVAARLELLPRVCDAVRYAHRHMVIHRDSKPGNILVDTEGCPKLLDFGIAKLLDPEFQPGKGAEASTGIRLMTPEYASPEQALGKPVSAATDVYSLARCSMKC